MLGTPRTLLTQPGAIAWAVFDPAFYAAANPAAAARDDLLAHYLGAGAAAGFSPNPWFDEAFYRSSHPDVPIEDGLFASGFEHYCQVGYPDHAPHPLFDPAFYRAQNPALTEAVLRSAGFANLYDHYLKYGAAEGRLAHPRFDPAFYAANLPADQAEACRRTGGFQHFLSRWWLATDAAEPPTSAIMDPPRIKLNIDRPRIVDGRAVEPVVGHLDLVGWAAANHPVDAVEVFADGVSIGRAHHGMRTDGVAAAFPELTHAAAAGFRFIGPIGLPAGVHQIRVLASGAGGSEAAETFEIDLQSPLERDGPWALRRRMRKSEADFKLALLAKANVQPLFQVLVRDAPPDEAAMARTMRSLARQIYPHWTLSGDTAPVEDGWLVELTPGDELGVDALLELALHRLTDPAADFIYSDERRRDPTTGAIAPFFKPDWSPDLLLSMNYIGRAWAAAADLARRAPAAMAGFDLVLHLTAQARRIGHVPKVLLDSVADPDDEGAALDRALRAWGLAGTIDPGAVAGTWRVRWALLGAPTVSIIILTAGKRDLIETALRTLRAHTAYPALDVLVVDTTPDAPGRWKATAHALADRMIEDPAPFNWAAMNNRAAHSTTGDVLVFLNDDIRFDGPWLLPMLEQIQRLEVGVVGPLLVYPDGIIQQAGMILTKSGATHAFHGVAESAPGPFGLARVQRNVAAVTGACLMVRREVFTRLGGFDERFDLINNDLDFCLRCEAVGLLTVFTPHARLIHHESATRAGRPEAPNAALFQTLWRDRLWLGDRWFNPNLAADASDYRPEWEPVEIIWPARPLAARDSVRRILVIKIDQMGDFVLALPAIARLRAHFPWATLTVLTASGLGWLAEPDEVLVWDPSVLTDLPSRRFDLAVDLRCHADSRFVLAASGATWRAGFDAAYAFPWLDVVALMEPDIAGAAKRTHMADRLLDFIDTVAAAFTDAPAVKRRPAPAWPDGLARPPRDKLLIGMHPGAGSALKRWPLAHFAELIGRLQASLDGWVILVGSAEEVALAEELLARVGPGVGSAVGKTDTEGLAAVIGACDVFVGNDSGPHHLAAALGVPTVGIHSGVVDAHEWGPIGGVAVRRRVVCSPCYLGEAAGCPREMACMEGIGPSMVSQIISNVYSFASPRYRIGELS